MQIMDAIYRRRTVRNYTGEPVRTEVIEAVIGAAIQAPSSMNRQPWHFTVVRKPRLMDRISRGAKAHLLQYLPPDGEHHFDELLRDPDYQIFHHAPVLIVISAVHDGAWTIEDCALAGGNLMLAAVGHGLGSCWVGLAQSWLQLPEGKAALGVDDDCVPVAPIVIGHPRGTTRPVARTPARVHWIG